MKREPENYRLYKRLRKQGLHGWGAVFKAFAEGSPNLRVMVHPTVLGVPPTGPDFVPVVHKRPRTK